MIRACLSSSATTNSTTPTAGNTVHSPSSLPCFRIHLARQQYDFNLCDKLRPLVGNPPRARIRIVKSGVFRIGLYGLTLSLPDYAAVMSDPVKTSCLQVAELRAKGVDAVVALTHSPWRTDLELLGLGADARALPAS